jgi:hypothetical protein
MDTGVKASENGDEAAAAKTAVRASELVIMLLIDKMLVSNKQASNTMRRR